MRQVRTVASMLLVLVPCAAQDLQAAFASIRSAMAASDLQQSSDRLLGVAPLVESEADCAAAEELFLAIGVSLFGEGRNSRCLQLAEARLAMLRRVYGAQDRSEIAQAQNNLGTLLRRLGRVREALAAYEVAVTMIRRLHLDQDHEDVAAFTRNLAACLEELGQTKEALPLHEQALAMARRLANGEDASSVATAIHYVAHCLGTLGRDDEALPLNEEALAMRRRLAKGRDDADVAASLNNLGVCMFRLGRLDDARRISEETLAMERRLHPEGANAAIASLTNNLAVIQGALGNPAEALRWNREALALRREVFGEQHPLVAASINNVGVTLLELNRAAEALPELQQALALRELAYGTDDHPDVAASLANIGSALNELGRYDEALRLLERSVAMRGRLYGDRDHPSVVSGRTSLAHCLESVGRHDEALRLHEQCLMMLRRIHGERDHPAIASSLNSIAYSLRAMGRYDLALTRYREALAMRRRLIPGDSAIVATSLNNVAVCLSLAGGVAEALELHEEVLAMRVRLLGDDSPQIAGSYANIATGLRELGRHDEALAMSERAFGILQRAYRGRAHPQLANCLNGQGCELKALGRTEAALERFQAAFVMLRELYGDGDHDDVVVVSTQLASCLFALGRREEARSYSERACAMIERLRARLRASDDMQQSFFDDMKSGGAFEILQALTYESDPEMALWAAERSRGRDLLDLLEQQRFDGFAEAERRARRRGDTAAVEQLQRLAADLRVSELERDRLLQQLTRLDDVELDEAQRQQRREELLTVAAQAGERWRQLQDESARLLSDVSPAGHVCRPDEVRAALEPGELLIEFTVTPHCAVVYVVPPDPAELAAVALPAAHPTVARVLPALLRRASQAQVRGRDPDAAATDVGPGPEANSELFRSLFPATVWERVRRARRVFLAPHRDLHRLPFEALVVGMADGRPVTWLEAGPPISYVPSGSALRWLRSRAREVRDDATALEVLVVGDPRVDERAPPPPERGVLVLSVTEGSEGARVGVRPGDVLTSYDGVELADDRALRDARTRVAADVEDGRRAATAIRVEVWRSGKTLAVEVAPGLLGVRVGRGGARAASAASAAGNAPGVVRSGELERLRSLPPLAGARREAEAVATVFREHAATGTVLLGADATEPAVFDLAAKARYLHIACHGIAEEYAGTSMSMLVLSPPEVVLPGDDGLLKLTDLLDHWRGRLSSCRLVTLSACRTNVGPTLRDEAPQALPVGFMVSGASAVISSLWTVDDASTCELMTEFYQRLLAGETDRLAAFVAARRALMVRYPDPFHWAPFLYMGSPK